MSQFVVARFIARCDVVKLRQSNRAMNRATTN